MRQEAGLLSVAASRGACCRLQLGVGLGGSFGSYAAARGASQVLVADAGGTDVGQYQATKGGEGRLWLMMSNEATGVSDEVRGPPMR